MTAIAVDGGRRRWSGGRDGGRGRRVELKRWSGGLAMALERKGGGVRVAAAVLEGEEATVAIESGT